MRSAKYKRGPDEAATFAAMVREIRRRPGYSLIGFGCAMEGYWIGFGFPGEDRLCSDDARELMRDVPVSNSELARALGGIAAAIDIDWLGHSENRWGLARTMFIAERRGLIEADDATGCVLTFQSTEGQILAVSGSTLPEKHLPPYVTQAAVHTVGEFDTALDGFGMWS
jgi:hypothetical protein